jgi:pimeloyl-ACP methyl ester carboxylesterase
MELTHTTADDGTRLAVHLTDGPGAPLLCLPGGPMLESAYLGDLGGLPNHRALALLDLRGTGASDVPADPATYHCDRQVADVEAVRRQLGLERLDVLGHSAGANLAYRYAEVHPDRVARLLLVTPSPRGVGVDRQDDERARLAASRSHEPWYAEASAAFARVMDGSATDADWSAIDPFTYGRWDDDVRAYNDWMNARRHPAAAEAYAEGYDPAVTVPALAVLDVPVLVLGGELDLGNPPGLMSDVAAVFPSAELVVQEGAGHFPWVDDPDRFVELVRSFVS